MSDVRAFARSVKRPAGRIAGVVTDYLQLMSGPAGQSRYEIVTENARQFKIMARELDCPVILLSQLNRNSENRMDKRPGLADLRDSGAIEQDSDVVMMLYKDPDFEQAPVDMPPLPVPLELNVPKNRHGATRLITLRWEGTQMRAY
jgi:replicative DNA helicase